MADYRLALMAGIDIPIPELSLVVHVPTVKDIAYMGEQEFFLAVQYICLEKESLVQDETLLASLTNFQVLMKVLEQSKDKEKKTAITTLLQLLFPNYTSIFTKNSIILRQVDGDNTVLIDTENFDSFQAALKEILCVSSLFQGENIVYNPANKRAKEIADKIMRGRRKVAELKSKESNNSVLTRYVSVLTVAGVASLEQCLQCNLFQLFDLMERYTSYVEWDADLRVRLAGGKPDKPVESWMRDLHSTKSNAFNAGGMSDLIQMY